MKQLKTKILDGKRIDAAEALSLFGLDLAELGLLADARRRLAKPDNEVGFIVDRIVNYTNVCAAKCAFCAYHAKAGQIAAYELSLDEILAKVSELVEAGGTQVMLQGGMHPDHTLATYVAMLQAVKSRFPHVWLHSFSPAELTDLARKEHLSLDEVVIALKAAGLDSMPGASDLLVERIRRQVSPHKASVSEWVEAIRTLARHGLKSSATMTYGLGETLAEKIEHLDVIRTTQDECQNLMAFIPWSFSPANTQLAHLPQATGVDYLKIVAIGRIYLDNITYIQSGWLTEGLKLAQIALTMGANDMGGVLTEELVVKATGITTAVSQNQMIDLITNAGKIAVQRDSLYRVVRATN